MDSSKTRSRALLRRLGGAALALLGAVALFGGLFAPIDAMLARPQLIPMPEAALAVLAILLGALMALWPSERSR